jgi:hypothetical protein
MDIEHDPPTIHPKARKFIYNLFFKNTKIKKEKKRRKKKKSSKTQ